MISYICNGHLLTPSENYNFLITMSKQKDNFFTTLKEAVKHVLKSGENNLEGERNIQQDLADAMDMNKSNLSRELGKDKDIASTMLGRIEKTLGYKFKRQPNGWTAKKLQLNDNINNLERLIGLIEYRTSDDNNTSLFQDDPLKALEVAEKLIRGYRQSILKKGQKE